MFMLLPPLSVMVLHTGRYLSADLDAASSAARLSMLSVPMLFCWAIPYFYFCRWFDGRLSSRQEEMVASSIASTVAAFLIQEAYRPWWTPLTTRPAAQLVGVIGILLLAALLLRRSLETASDSVDIFPKGNTMATMADSKARRTRRSFRFGGHLSKGEYDGHHGRQQGAADAAELHGRLLQELIEVDLQLRLADAVVGADQPLLQIPDGPVREWHHGRGAFSQVARARLSPGHVRHACGLQLLEAFQPVGADRRPRRDVVLDELDHRGLPEVRDHRHPNPARRRARCAWSSMRVEDGRGRGARFGVDRVVAPQLGRAGPGGSDQGQDRANDRGALPS